MSELISNLNTIESCKMDIKSAIEAKGVDMTSASLPDYAACIGSITTQFVTTSLSVSQNGTYTPGQGVDGYSEVVVDVPQSVIGYSFSQCVERSYLSSVIDDTVATQVAPWALAGGYWYYSNNTKKIYRYPTKISSVNLQNVTFVGEYGLAYNSMLTYLSLPKCNQLLNNAFEGCCLISIDLPSCSYIYEKTFSDCTSLVSVFLSNCVLLAGTSIFYNCYRLSDVRLPKCSYIGSYAFNGCSALSIIYLPKCSKLENYAFSGCSALSSIIIEYSSVCVLNNSNVFNNTPIKLGTGGIYVPASLVNAYKQAQNWSQFAGVIQPILSDFEFSNGLVYGWATSMDSTYLTTLGISADDVTAVSMSKLTSLASSTFMNHQNLVSVNIPLVSEYGDNLFNGCTSLSEYYIKYSGGVITLGTGVFDNCPALNTIYIPYGMLSSYQTAPGWSEYSIIMVETLPELSFSNGLVFGITSTINSAFTTTLGITKNQVISVDLPSVMTTGNQTFYSCQQLTTVSMNNCTSLSDSCFAECLKLQTLSLPKCEYIGSRCFQGAFQQNTTGSYISLDLPVCSYIGASAFYWTKRYLTLTLGYDGIVSLPSGSYTFDNTSIRSIYVPASLIENYKVANGWSVYSNRIFPITE